MQNPQLVIKSSPHLRTEETTPRIMWIVVGTLAPALLMGFYAFGPRAILLTVAATLGALITEVVSDRWREGSWRVTTDGSAPVTGILLAMCLPPGFPLFEAFLGGVVAIALGKQVFGGLGWNIFNPALVGRAFLQAAFPVEITTWSAPLQQNWFKLDVDALSGATPLAQMKFDHMAPTLEKLVVGTTGGSMGETSALLLIIGGIVLVILRIVDWKIPVGMITTVYVFSGLLHLAAPDIYANPLSQIFAGGLMLGAWYMATDLVTSPITGKGRLLYAIAIGILVVVIRMWGGLPEGVMYSILLLNAFTPLINRYMKPRLFAEAAR
jgi:Na+-translocating ferredoxin:NAD+ oxidoreductase subunit D